MLSIFYSAGRNHRGGWRQTSYPLELKSDAIGCTDALAQAAWRPCLSAASLVLRVSRVP